MGVNKRIEQSSDTKTKMQNSHIRNVNEISSDNHSKDIEVNDSTDLVSSVKCKSEYGCQIETRCSLIEYGLHKNEDEYGKGSIRRRIRFDVHGGARRAADLKFKCVRETEVYTDAFGRTMGVHVRVVAVIGLVFMLLTTSAAAPARSRPGRSAHIETKAVSNLILSI
ncbi:unnamed protein product [Euphydryas editha]|uniref:Uncharacterized protein n=1 Tax=Euphydryas editha TaxID=104508 RepID=A0AAU9U893_EUPED|nr:unnamed protein product [Euphydryas editha]